MSVFFNYFLVYVRTVLYDHQVRGRSERRAIENSFVDMYALRLLYPSTGGYMFPIRGMVVKKGYHSLWVVYSKEDNEQGGEEYIPIGAFPPHPTPSQEAISNLFANQKS